MFHDGLLPSTSKSHIGLSLTRQHHSDIRYHCTDQEYSDPKVHIPCVTRSSLTVNSCSPPCSSKNLTALAGIPSAFECEVVYDHDSPSINPLSLLLNAVNAAYELSGREQRRKWPLSQLTVPENALEVIYGPAPWMSAEPLLLETRFVLWTLLFMSVEVSVTETWKPVAGVALWHKEVMGMVSIQERSGGGDARKALVEDHVEDSLVDLPMDASIDKSAKSFTVAAPGKLFVRVHFNEARGLLPSMEVFNLAVSTFVTVAERGLESRTDNFTEHGATFAMTSIEIIAKEDSHGNVQLRYRYVRSTMRLLINEMIAKKKFVTAELQLLEDGVEIATGEVSRRT